MRDTKWVTQVRDAGVLTDGRAEDVGMDPARIELIRTRARSWVAGGDTPSLVLLVARNGVIVLEEAYGILRPSDNAPLRADSIFPVMSVSKSFTAAAIMCLVEDGLLSLKHPITDYLPELTAPGSDQVLVADLLTHTSGYDDMVVMPHAAKRYVQQLPVPEPAANQHPEINRLIHYAADAPLTHAPGDVMCYCNFGYLLLGDIVRRVSGEAFAAFVHAKIFEPLGMNSSTFLTTPALRARRVLRHPSCPDLPTLYPEFPTAHCPRADSEAFDAYDSGACGAVSNARDLAVFTQMLLNRGTYGGRRVLSRASIAAMTAPQLAPGTHMRFTMFNPVTGAPEEFPVRGGNYGFGLFATTRDDRSAYINGSLVSPGGFAHSGALGSLFWGDPQTGVVGVYLSVSPRLLANGTPLFWRADHFQDLVHAAVVD